MSLPLQGKENLLAKTTPSLTRHLTAIRGSDSLSVAKQTERASGRKRLGAFSFAAIESLFVLRERGLRIGAASKRGIDLWQLFDQVTAERRS